MHPDVPLSAVIGQIIGHTPLYAWAILAALAAAGALQLRDRRVSRTRLLVAPFALGAFSLWGAAHAFGATPAVVGAWLAGVALAVLANRALRWPRDVRADGDDLLVPGSAGPLLLMLGIFGLRYAVAVTLALHPEARSDPAFVMAMALLYGGMSGLFAARALRILQSGARAGYAAA
jgi:hypothetical protein